MKTAVILCGSGFRDGSEIRESVAALWALSEEGSEVGCFAIDAPQADVVNCLTGEVAVGESRNMLVESARIARSKVQNITALHAKDWDAVIVPGGYGVAKNLCTFATKGSAGTANPAVAAVLRDFHAAQKPIGAICIAPALLALVFKEKGLELTVGERGEAAQEMEKLGAKMFATKVTETHVDRKNRVVTTGAYMFEDPPLAGVFAGIRKLVGEVCEMARR